LIKIMEGTNVLHAMVEELLTPNDSQVLWLEVKIISLLEETEVLGQISLLDGIMTLLQLFGKRIKYSQLVLGGGSARAMSVHLQLRQMFPLRKERLNHTSITRSILQSPGSSASTGKAGAARYGVKFPSFLGASCTYLSDINVRDASGSQFRRL
jgi:hypothetical protein